MVVTRKKVAKRLSEPPTNCNVYPKQQCPAFSPRCGALPGERECWFCKYADFHIESERPLDVGICGYPKVNAKY